MAITSFATRGSTVTEGGNLELMLTRENNFQDRTFLDIQLVPAAMPAPLQVSAADLATPTDSGWYANATNTDTNSLRVVFEPGEVEKTILIPTFDDTTFEPNEVMRADIRGLTYYGWDQWVYDPYNTSAPQAYFTILDNDAIAPAPAPVTPEPTPVAPVTEEVAVTPATTSLNVTGNHNSVVNGNNNVIYQITYMGDYNAYNGTFTFTYDNSFNGTQRADSLTGTVENDQIAGLNGADVLQGMAGNDELIGGKGSDDLYGGTGANVFDTGLGKDDIFLTVEEGNSAAVDIIENLGVKDDIMFQNLDSDAQVSIGTVDNGLGIFVDDTLQAVYTGGDLSQSALASTLDF